jgi:hypothetical protein
MILLGILLLILGALFGISILCAVRHQHSVDDWRDLDRRRSDLLDTRRA